jgi:two-component system cell cycle response regulator CtrA
MRILLVEDDQNTGEIIQRFLRDENLFCDFMTTGEEAFQISKIYDYDVIVLDIGLPDINGHELLQKFRESSIKAPILILSGFQSIHDKVRAIGFGADDYMTKPFASEELVVRIKALARRAEGHSSALIRVGEIELNLDTQTIEVRDIPLELTGKEYQILEFLLVRRGATVTKNNFLNRLYSGMDEPEEKIIDVFMCKIRKKLQDILGPTGREYIETIWGRGYVLREPSKGNAAPSGPNNVISVHKGVVGFSGIAKVEPGRQQ